MLLPSCSGYESLCGRLRVRAKVRASEVRVSEIASGIERGVVCFVYGVGKFMAGWNGGCGDCIYAAEEGEGGRLRRGRTGRAESMAPQPAR